MRYSSHDGYDYTHYPYLLQGDDVLAAAAGWVTYRFNEVYTGNSLFIDHGNGYQTRYYHLLNNDLITSGPKVWVEKGQKIGHVGSTGRSSTGPHLHFMVVQDKNNDGNFDDNIPDGITDPYGWQSDEPDPWENFTFPYNGQRMGNKSYYLWDKQLDKLDEKLNSNGGVFHTERYELIFPQNFTDQNLTFHMEAAPTVKANNGLESVGSSIITWTKDALGNEISQYQALYKLIIDYKAYDLRRFDPNTIAIYSSKDGIEWFREDTQIDFLNKKASTNINHMTYFALMGQPSDKYPPTTQATLEGITNTDNWYRSNVKVSLNSKDNENGLGVLYTYYKIANQEWQSYTTPIEFSDEGSYHVEFYSVDQEYNVELPRILEFSIDKTHPEAKIFADQDLFDLTLQAIDQNQTSIEITPLNKKDQKQYTIKDLAGNSLNLWVKYKDKQKKDSFQIDQISYNDEPPKDLDKNNILFTYKQKKEKPRLEKQSFDSEDKKKEPEIKMEYNFEKDQTQIEEKINNQKIKQTIPGFRLLQVLTNNGTLEYTY